jgi:hypothetical protein
MPEQNPCLDRIAITTEWTALVAPTPCTLVIAIGSVDWQWCSSPDAAQEKEAYQSILAGVRENISEQASLVRMSARYGKNSVICYVKGSTQSGFLLLKYGL